MRAGAPPAQETLTPSLRVQRHGADHFTKLDLPPADGTHRRVLAVLAFLRA